jgi:pimeloyl-ACP methyl ester carboxylesterase
MSEILFEEKKIHYQVQGHGKKVPLVLLHGFLEDSRIWDDLVQDLKKDRQVICIDLPGHGLSKGISEVHTMKLMAEIVYEVLAKLELKEISMAGHSMGGYVSLEFLKNYPMMLKSIVLINSTPVDDSVEKQKIRERSVALVGKNKNAFISMAISNLYSESSKTRLENEIEDLKSRARKMEAKNIQAALKGMKIRTNILEELKSFSKQKIIIAGEEDPLLEISEIERISQVCECEFSRLNNGHNSYMEEPNKLTKIMHFID